MMSVEQRYRTIFWFTEPMIPDAEIDDRPRRDIQSQFRKRACEERVALVSVICRDVNELLSVCRFHNAGEWH